MASIYMRAQSEVTSLDSQYITLVEQSKYAEAEELLRGNKDVFISQYGDFDFSYGITLARMLSYTNNQKAILLDGISDEIKTVLSKYLSKGPMLSNYFKDWGNYLYFCTLSSCRNNTNIDLCIKANDLYANDSTKNIIGNYFYISKVLWEYFYNQSQRKETHAIIDKVIAKASICNSLSTLAECYYVKGLVEKNNNNWDKAISFWDESIMYFNKCDNAKAITDYANVLFEYASYFQNKGSYAKSISYAQNLPEICKGIYGYYSTENVNALLLLSIDQYNLQEGEAAIKNIQIAKNICDSTSSISPLARNNVLSSYQRLTILTSPKTSSNTLEQTIVLNDSSVNDRDIAALNYLQKGEYGKAVEIYEAIFSYYCKNDVSVQNSQIFLRCVCRLATSYAALGKFDLADKCLHEGAKIVAEKQIKTNDVRHLYAALGINYYYMHDYKDALSNMYQAKRMFEIINDKYGAEYAKLLGNMAMIFAEEGNILKALVYNEEAESLLRKSKITNIKEYCNIVNNLAVIYSKTNNYSKAISLLQELAKTTKEKNLSEEYGLSLGNLGDTYLLSENYASAISCFKEVLPLIQIESTRNVLWQELIYALCLSNSPEYDIQVSKYNDEMRERIAKIVGSFSEREWDGYWTENSKNLVALNNIGLAHSDKKTCIRAYENALYVKNMTLNASDVFNRIASSSNNQKIISAYNKLKINQNRLVDKTVPTDSLSGIKREIIEAQKYIVRNTNISEYLIKNMPKFSNIEETLANNECVVEFVFRPELISIKDKNYHLRYGALCFRKGMDAPKFIDLCTEDDFISLIDSTAQKIYDKQNSKLFNLLWQPLENFLKKGDVVYYSLCGDMGEVNHSAVSNGKQCIGDIYDMRLLSSTGKIPQLKVSNSVYSNAVVYGGVNYEEPINEMVVESKRYNKRVSTEDLLAIRGEYMRDGWQPLPGTLKEAEAISSLLTDKRITVRFLKGNKANEESFKNLSGNSPDILHVATHGFYIEADDDSMGKYFKSTNGNTLRDQIMQRSGLLFSGANNSWKGNYPVNAEDGILTSEELSRLDLSNTKLAILSACKTGLGETGFVDGVFGLQRGLKKAGVETIIMSLWSIDDEVTAEFMQNFYKFLLNENSKQEAFKHATAIIKAEYPEARYWASFVMLD